MITIGNVIPEIFRLLTSLITTENIALFSAIGGIGYKGFKVLMKAMDSKQDAMISTINKRLSDLEINNEAAHSKIEREVLRLQILDGIESHRLSESEMLYFYDRYKKLGGNSFVEHKALDYLAHLREEGLYDQ